MEVLETPLQGLLVLQPRIFKDERGYFYESYNESVFEKLGLKYHFMQDNQSCSHKNVLRGLHFQNPPHEQGKLVRVVKGSVLDVTVDIRRKSATYGQYFKIELSETNHTMLWVPPGFAHGFAALEDNSLFLYKCTHQYNKDAEDTILWNDSTLGIDWGLSSPLVSEKDQQGKSFDQFKSLF
jgi:dTDP-4-dehydrorhamnose 3,5-epimerase